MKKGILIIILSLFLDRITKILTVKNFEFYKADYIIDGFFYFTRAENEGGAWSLLSGNTGFFIFVTIIALVAFFYLFTKVDFKSKKFYSIGISMIIGGTLGNFFDRLFNGGKVVDFIGFIIFGYHFPIFNIADMSLCIGLAIFAVDVIIFEEKRKKEKND